MRTENREKFIFFHLFFYFVAPAGFEPATSPPKGDVLPLHHGALDSFVPVVLAARVVAASEPMPVCCASAIRRRGAVSSSLAHDPPIWVLSAYPILFLPLRAGVILPEHQTPHLCGWLSLRCRRDSNPLRPLQASPSNAAPFAGLSRPSSCCEPHGGLQGIITLIAYAHWRRANLCQAPKPQNTLLSKTPIMNTTGFGRSHFNPAPSIFSAFRSASTSSRLNSIAEFLAAPAFIPRIFFRLI